MVCVMVVMALRHLLLERLSSMLVVAVAVLNHLQLQPPGVMAAVELEIVELVLLLQQELQTQVAVAVAVEIREQRAAQAL